MKIDENEEAFNFYKEYFLLSKTKLQDLMQDLTNSFTSGLENHNKISIADSIIQHPLKMLDSCINQLPSGNEQGIYYAIDMGGTNLRCVRVHLKGNGKCESKQKKIKLSDMKIRKSEIHDHLNESIDINETYLNKEIEVSIVNKLASSNDMFNSIANFFYEFLIECGDIHISNENGSRKLRDKKFELAFTFSFPTTQFELGKASLISWTKGIETGRDTLNPVEGNDVGELLNLAFERNGIPAHCKCIINDTVGTLLSAMYDFNISMNNNEINEQNNNDLYKEISKKPLIGIVIGTGVNACYVEPRSRYYGYRGLIINTECGDFYSLNLPITDCDLVLDWHSDNKGYQRFEKMISGTYLGEVSRLLFINILKHKTPHIFYKKDSITTEQISKIIDKFDENEDIYFLEKYLKDIFLAEFDSSSAYLIASISNMVLKRAASLVSVLIAVLIEKIEKRHEKITIAIDGSVWTRIPKFQRYVTESLCTILGEHILENVQFYESDDGSGKGAAVLASVIS